MTKKISGTISGKILEIRRPIRGAKGKIIRVIPIVEDDGVVNFPQLHNNERKLIGLNPGDRVNISYRIYGKEHKTNQYTTLVIQELEKDGNYIE